MKVYHNMKLTKEMIKSDKQSLAQQLNLVQNQESATCSPLEPQRIYQNFQSPELKEEDHSNFLEFGQKMYF